MNKSKAFAYGLIAITLALTACKQPTEPKHEPEHEHEWGAWIQIAAPTCTTVGTENRTCALDPAHIETKDIAIVPNAHNWQLSPTATAPTCTVDGNGEQICAYNDVHIQKSVIPKLGHDYQYKTTTAPTCTTAGAETGTCAHDQTHIINLVVAIDPAAHVWLDSYTVTTHATCSLAGIETDTCAYSETHTKTQTIAINPDAHAWSAWNVTTPATETHDGEEQRTCAHNAAHVERNPLAALNHTHVWGAWQVITPADCTEKGERERVCQSNTDHKDYEDIAPLGHDAGAWHITLAATCTATGTRQLRCNRDNFVINTDTIDALGHDWGGWVIITAPTATKSGAQTRACQRDANHTEEQTIPATGIKANPTVTWPTGLTATYGQTLLNIPLTSYSNGGGTPGAFSWTTPSNPVGNVGTQSHSMTFTPTDTADYNTLSQNVSITVAKATGANVGAPTPNSTTHNSVTINPVTASTGQTVEYARNSTNTAPSTGWQTGATFGGLNAGITYYFFARSVGNGNYETGAPSAGAAIATKQQAGDDTIITYWVDDTGELSVGNGGQGNTVTVSNGGSVTFTANGAGYSNQSWTLNGNTVGSGASYTFNTADNDKEMGRNYIIGKQKQKDGRFYFTEIIVKVVE
jgi:hypothetical protein